MRDPLPCPISVFRIATHEYSTILLTRISRQRAGWQFHSAPAWVVQGMKSTRCILAGDRTRKITLGKYRELVGRTPSRAYDGEVADSFIDGAVLIDFLHAEFGREKVQAIMSNPAARLRRCSQAWICAGS